ncbi:hypothetical protein [Psychromonas sp. KJ10-2]|uniref:hypothetical protein n=1 Tax=Psychromonas sp. KJ10-2 TaxID=3391822 RepID=UPI0039B37F4E
MNKIMKMKSININYNKLKKQSISLQSANVLLVVMLGVSLFYNTQKDTIVINNANATCELVEMGRYRMGESSHINLGYYMAEMLGNITPQNAKFIENAVMPFVDANVYREVETILSARAKKYCR